MNDYNKQKKKKKLLLIATVVILLFSTVSLLVSRTSTGLEQIFRDSVSTIEYFVIKKPISFVGDLIDEYSSLKDVYQENKVLKDALADYRDTEAEKALLQSELDALKELTNIDSVPSDYVQKITTVTTRLPSSWMQEITIDTGSLGDVEVGMAVITAQGMIGTITETSALTAKVSLLTKENHVDRIQVMIINGEETIYGHLESYDVKTGTYQVMLFSDIESISGEDVKVLTSGLGDVPCPRGLLVGTVQELGTAEDGISKTLTVTPAADFNDLRYVSVVQKGGASE